jgi:hypothetical protein
MGALLDNAVDELRSAISGTVYLRGEEGYAAEIGGFNLLSPNNPDLVVTPADEAEVQAVVRWARAQGVTVHPQATGHGAYRQLDSGLLLKTSRLDSLVIDAENARFTLGAGLTWQDIVPGLHAAGLGAVTGSAKTVGAVGLVMGGGIGPVGRTLGMAGDWVRGFRVVDGNGDVLVATPTENDDLFWALRGGKVGLGVVTEMTVEAPRMPFVYGGGVFYAEEDIDRLAHAWLDWVPNLPESANTSFAILRLPPTLPAPLGGATVFHVRFAYVEIGASNDELAERGEEIFATWRAIAGNGILDTVGILPSDRIAEIHSEPTDPLPLWEWGDFLGKVDHELIDVLVENVGGGVSSPLATVEVRYHGGALARDPEYPSAIGGRKEPFTLLVLGVPIDGIAPWDVVEAAGYAIRDRLTTYCGAEVNYNWAGHPTAEIFQNRLWSKENALRLREIRSAHDPAGIFEHGN